MPNNVNKNNPFKVPENYFDDFHKEMMGKIQSETKAKIVVPLWRKVLPWTGVAALLCGVVISITLLAPTKTSRIANSDNTEKNGQTEMYALSDEDYFMLYLEDEAAKNSYNEYIYTNLSN